MYLQTVIKFCRSTKLRSALVLLAFGITAMMSVFYLKVTSASAAVTLTVTNINDSGAGSLRQAIIDANANPGLDNIIFSINSGIQTIRPVTALPAVTDPILIDGSTQPGFAGTPLIVIDGSLITGSGDVFGLRLSTSGSTIRSLAVNNFQNPAPQAIRIDTGDGNKVEGCYIGIDPNGITSRRNYVGIVIVSSGNLIGGNTPATRNVISASSFDNISIVGAGSNNQIKGNYIGTNAAGTSSLNGGGYGIEIFSTGSDNSVGGTEPGAGNLISGNGQSGISAGARGTVIQGNLIGTDITGRMAVPNTNSGIAIAGSDILVGGTTAAARNVISGNGGGISVTSGNTTNRSRIQGNYIGVNITGDAILSNSFAGISTSASVTVGGTEPGAGNVISGNLGGGLTISSFDNTGSLIQGNLIGTDVTGTVAFGNGNGFGFDIRSSNNVIGGTTPGSRNIISGNTTAIDIGSATTAQLTGNVIQGNYFGTDITGAMPLPNRGAQTILVRGANTTIGGVAPGAGNLIAFNNGTGIRLAAFIGSNNNNVIRGNSIFGNSGLAIDLGASGVTANDSCDVDSGSNNLQNYPVLNSAVSNGTTTTISGSLNSTANSPFVVDFYQSPTFDPTTFGEGKTFLGSVNVTTSSSCSGVIEAELPFGVIGNQFVTALATDSNGNTSEFSQYIRASGTGFSPSFDYDGDGKSDISVFRPENGKWYLNRSISGFAEVFFGQSGDEIVPADYDGDGKTDIAVFRDGNWFALRSSDNSFSAVFFGQKGDIPVAGDFDGDNKADQAVFRSGTWYLNRSTLGYTSVQFGFATDKPVAADYDGDGQTDVAVYRNGIWYALRSSNSSVAAISFGNSTDVPVQADYDGDGRDDQAVFRSGVWYLNQSTAGFASVAFGNSADAPVAADYDGDGRADVAVFRAGVWYLQQSSAGFAAVSFGQTGDRPTPNAFVP